ncbi:MAG: cytochrome c oxidase accessory protein CcoG [Gammaproteobacteria bacterium]|nr:cytochrome c oxidase accessory protein CcoG [Gammaproteobacteria bacterium]
MSKEQNVAIEDELYAKREKIYPRQVSGVFASLRLSGVLGLLGIYYLFPWFNWDGRQAVLFDLPARKFYIFDLVFWPQDFFYLALLLIIAALSLFFFTALAGRLWCGYACPQTVWTEVFLWIDRKVEGDRSKAMKLDKAPWTANKIIRKSIKHVLWIVFSLFTGYTFVGWFTPIDELTTTLINLEAGPWETFWVFFYGSATYLNAGWMREQVCIYMCPYARFQSAMFDKDTLIISYDEERGEPRGSRKKNIDPKEKGLGDCIDCTLCKQVCPTGIDIRDGLQYQCIGCAACVDVCNSVMDKMGYERGLVRYTTEHSLQGKAAHVLRTRIIVYAVLLVVLLVGLIYAIGQRIPLELDIIRDRNSLYRTTESGLVENIYTLKVINMDELDHTYHLSISGLQGASLITRTTDVKVEAGAVMELPVRVSIDPYKLKQTSTELQFHLQSIDKQDLSIVETGRFIGPVTR